MGPTRGTREPRCSGSGVVSGFQSCMDPPWACFIPSDASITFGQLSSQQEFRFVVSLKPLTLDHCKMIAASRIPGDWPGQFWTVSQVTSLLRWDHWVLVPKNSAYKKVTFSFGSSWASLFVA